MKLFFPSTAAAAAEQGSVRGEPAFTEADHRARSPSQTTEATAAAASSVVCGCECVLIVSRTRRASLASRDGATQSAISLGARCSLSIFRGGGVDRNASGRRQKYIFLLD